MKTVELRYARLIETGVAFLLIVYPSLMFAVKGGMNGAFLLLLLLSLAALVVRPRAMPGMMWDKEVTYYLLAMTAMPIAIFLSQTYHHHYSGHPYDGASRYLLAIPIFLVLRRARFSDVAQVQYGFPLAAIVGCFMLRELPGSGGRSGIATLDLIHFGDFELVLGVLSVLSINWAGRDGWLSHALKIIGFLAATYASFASGTRGGWLALPVFLVIFINFKFGKISLKSISALSFMLLVTGFVAYLANQEVHHRVADLTGDLTSLEQGNLDTSLGVRLQLYQSAAQIFAQNPLFGVGPEGFAAEMDGLLKAGKITALAADLGKGEVHNELLSKAAGLGVFGLIALLLIYLMPLRVFHRAMRSDLIAVRHSGMLGMVFVSGFMVFGLTVEVLNLTMAAAFYSLTVAVFLAACLNIHHGEPDSPDNP